MKHEDIPSMPYVPLHPSMPGSKYGGGQFSHLYNGMISPLYQFKIKGALWYQGENNGEEERTYVEKMKEMIAAWRNGWGYEFPFYIVQLSSWLKPVNDPNDWKKGWQFCRAAQLACVTEIPNTGIAVTYDIGDEEDIHPKNKYDVGERLALWALAHDYGKEISFSGPLYKTITLEEDRIRVNFNYSEDGLMIGRKEGKKEVEEDKIGKLQGFVIAGEDKVWYWADAKIEGNSVIVSSPFVNKPIAVRYAFSMNPRGANLYNRSGLPASPFRSDCW
ncbi:sialate O-acetylesterase [Bacteroides thetaiotaomicron]|nr:sialate O-acetylesterase [Bacteroides thetaiotaomicron]